MALKKIENFIVFICESNYHKNNFCIRTNPNWSKIADRISDSDSHSTILWINNWTNCFIV